MMSTGQTYFETNSIRGRLGSSAKLPMTDVSHHTHVKQVVQVGDLLWIDYSEGPRAPLPATS